MLIMLNNVNNISSSSTICSVRYVPLCIPFERKYMQIKNFVREALHIPWRKFMQTFTSCCQINVRKYCVWYWILEKINLSYSFKYDDQYTFNFNWKKKSACEIDWRSQKIWELKMVKNYRLAHLLQPRLGPKVDKSFWVITHFLC